MYHWSFTGVNCRKLVLMMPEVYDSTNSSPQNKAVSALEYKREIIKQVKTNMAINRELRFSSVQLLSRVRLFATPWTVACQASLSITNSQRLLKLMSIELMMPSNHLIFCYPLLLLPSIFPCIRVFSKSQFLASGSQSIGASASPSVLPMNVQD